jgi:hypothetical protein
MNIAAEPKDIEAIRREPMPRVGANLIPPSQTILIVKLRLRQLTANQYLEFQTRIA